MVTKLWVYNSGFWNGAVASRRSPSYDGTLRAICVSIPTYLYRARPPARYSPFARQPVPTAPPFLGESFDPIFL